MTPSEAFERSRQSAKRIRQIDEELRTLRDRIGQQGYSMDYHSKNGILDPMRKLIDALDEEPDLNRERAQCLSEVSVAWSLINGMEHYARETFARADELRMSGESDLSREALEEAELVDGSVSIVTMWSVYARPMEDISRSMHKPIGECNMMLRAAMAWCDGVGMARLRCHVTYA